MWKIDKPNLIRAKGKDLNELVAHCDKLDDTDKQLLKQLYQQYDDQKGSVTNAQHDVISTDKAEAIHKMYKSTYENRSMAYIRDELMAKVYKCPYCSISQPNTLDHYMPESIYRALAVCRLNLVPMCTVCNGYKSVKQYDKFIHCYYDDFPSIRPFLVANVYTIRQRFVVKFKLDSVAIADPSLESRLMYQAKEIHLFERIEKEAVVYINTLCRDCEQNDTASLKLWLGRRLAERENEYGKNDWRCAIIRGMLMYPGLDITQIKHNKLNPRRINAGGA